MLFLKIKLKPPKGQTKSLTIGRYDFVLFYLKNVKLQIILN